MDKIYKYTSLDSAIKIIKSNKLLLNNPSKFNDPFDCSFGIDKNDEKRSSELVFNYCAIKTIYDLVNNENIKLTKSQQKLFAFIKGEFNIIKKLLNKRPSYTKIPMLNGFIKQIIKFNPKIKIDIDEYYNNFKVVMQKHIDEIKEKAIISCFSKRNDSMLMWSHYADSHRGICLEYEMPNKDNFRMVKYTNKRPKLKLYNLVSAYLGHLMIDKELKASDYEYTNELLSPFFIKSIDWKYEEEVRCIFTTDDYDNSDLESYGNTHYVKIGDIKRIFIGCRAAGVKVDEILKLAIHRRIPVVFMKESNDSFMIVPDNDHKHIPSKIKEEEKNGLLRLIEEVNNSLDKDLYLAAFTLALNIPSICGAKLYPDETEKNQYLKWANDWFSQYEKVPDDDKKDPYASAELLYDLRNKYEQNGTFNIKGDYKEFYLDKFILKYESKKPFNMYFEESLASDNYNELKMHTRDFCDKMALIGTKFYEKNKELFTNDDIICLEDYDKIIDTINEINVINDCINKRIK